MVAESHECQKHYYDLRCHHVTYRIGDLVKVKSHPRSDALNNFTAKLAPFYTGPYRISQKMSDVNYSLTKVSTGEEAGVYHVTNLQPFHTWATASPGKHTEHVTPDGQSCDLLECDLSSDIEHSDQNVDSDTRDVSVNVICEC